MNNGLQIFENTEFGSIRTLEINGEPWFVGKEVAEILGYSNSSKAVMSHVDNEDKRIEMLPNSQNGNTVGKVTLINESGLYSLILRSKLEKAKRFKRWVTSEVLPALRKHGMYVTDDLLKVFFYLFLGTVERTVILFNKPCFKAVSTIII